jgi:hypothetical protein
VGTLENHEKGGSMVINTEWGAFGDNGELDFIRNALVYLD